MKRRTIMLGLGSGVIPAATLKAFAQQKTDGQIIAALNDMGPALSSSFAKYGLDAIVWSIYSMRLDIKPMKYEGDPTWSQKFLKSYEEFHNVLWKYDPKQAGQLLLNDKEALEGLQVAYAKNRKSFEKFRDKALHSEGSPRFLRNTPPPAIASAMTNAQLYFAAFLHQLSKDSLSRAVSFTGIWPFCG